MTTTSAEPVRTTVVLRSDPDDRYAAVLTWRGPADLLTPLTAALTEWVQTTPDGRSAWENSSEDFNVGDLSNEALDDEPLRGILAKHGIHGLTVDIIAPTDGCHHWTYDTVLVDETDLPSGDDGAD